MPNASTTKPATETLTARCREALGRMAHNTAILRRHVDSDVRRKLLARSLVHEHVDGYITPTSRAAGYSHDPSTFEA